MDTAKVTGVVCPCPGTPHPDGDTVELRPRLGLAAGIELQNIIVQANREGRDTNSLTGILVEGYVRLGVCAWTFVDAAGKPVPVSPESIQSLLLDDFTRATPIAEKADELYEAMVVGPLVAAAATSSPSTPTESSTSPTDSGSPKSPTPSQPSSISTTPTEDTETTSDWPDGDSRSSQIEPMALLREAG